MNSGQALCETCLFWGTPEAPSEKGECRLHTDRGASGVISLIEVVQGAGAYGDAELYTSPRFGCAQHTSK